jgi:Aspartyl/Asparaginyl beta-hydroxylase
VKNRFFKLPFQFDVPRLLKDLDTCIQQDWTNHFNQKDYSGTWTGIALRSATGSATDIYANPDKEEYTDTEILSKCPYFQEIFTQFECKKETVRLLALAPNSHIKEHRDRGLCYTDGIFRLHIPITTDEKVRFIVDGSDLQMAKGTCWYANFDLPHSVEHHGTHRRIHLVVDCLRNEWSDALFDKAGYDFEEEKRLKSPTIAVKNQMIAHLELMNTDTARQLIAQLTIEIKQETAKNATNTEGVSDMDIFSSYKKSTEWIPTKLIKKDANWFTQWLYLNDKRFTKPFFGETLSQCKLHPYNYASNQHISSIQEMIEISENFPFVEPTAFIFHISRCGSTLLTQLLSTDERHIAVAEAPLLDAILNLYNKEKDISESNIDDIFQASVHLLGRKRTGKEAHFFIKLDSWHAFFYPILRRLYPSTPFILLCRTPEEVFYSQKKQAGLHAIPNMLDPALFGLTVNDMNPNDPDTYLGKVLESYYTAFMNILENDNKAHLINYKDGIDNMMQQVSEITKVYFDESTWSKMRTRSQFHAKKPHDVFEEKMPHKPLPVFLEKAHSAYLKLEKKSQQALLNNSSC